MIRRLLCSIGMCLTMTGCGEDFLQAREQWLNYVNSPAYYEDTYSSTFTYNGQTTTCYTTIDRRYGDTSTRCY